MITGAPMPETVKERWRTANRFADVLEAEVKTRRNPFAARVVSWFNLCRVCQDLEEQMLLAPLPAEEDAQLHRALLSTAIASGEGLLLECSDTESLEPLRLTPQGPGGQTRVAPHHVRPVAHRIEAGTAGSRSTGGLPWRGVKSWRPFSSPV